MSFNSSRSVDSGSKSKRSFNSTTSNRSGNASSNSDSSKKQKKTTQKTLGMAWGSNSRSASRSSFRNSPFSDFGSYMAVKNQKLQDQFEAEATSSSNSGSNSGKPIFQGVSIFVDGFTVPSSQELKGYMLKHGGRYENYFSRHRVTHIICSNLPDSKIKNLRSFSAGLPVVKPAWLLDSVAAYKLLSCMFSSLVDFFGGANFGSELECGHANQPIRLTQHIIENDREFGVPYQLDQVASETHNQPKLSSFFALKSSALSNDPTTCVTGQVNSEIEDPSLIGGTIKENDLSGRCGYAEHLRPCSRESKDWDDSVDGNSTSIKIGEATCNDGECSEGNVAEPSNVLPIDKGSVDDRDPASPSGPSASVISDNANKSMSSAIAGPSKRHHSTLVDPNFVENYFKKSRLHFIGTWRSRYRQRFPSSIYTSSNVNASGQRTYVIHVDMDCFFVSVVIRNHPELQDKPVAVCHSDNPRGTAEISSANYPARSHGVRAGIFVRDAKALCPHLTIFPYDFGAYEEVADQFYNILHKHCNKVQAVSCDEAFLEVRDFEVEDPQFLASVLRKEIVETTGCTASAGISGNLLMARLATKVAKPDGQCYIPPEKVDDYLNELPIKSLPGIGHVLEEKLKRIQIQTCGQLRMISKESLQKEFGVKTGDMLWNHSRGIDNRLVGVIQESKSVGAEVNWGVRFNDMKDVVSTFSHEPLQGGLIAFAGMCSGRTFTSNNVMSKLCCNDSSIRHKYPSSTVMVIRIKKRRSDAGEPVKYMGCGDCENLSHSVTVPMATDDVDTIRRISTQLFGSFHLDVKDIRGMGLQVSKLESVDTAKQGNERNSIRSWLASASAITKEQLEISCPAKESDSRDLREDKKKAIIELIYEYIDVFAWNYDEMPGLDPAVTTHQLNMLPLSPPNEAMHQQYLPLACPSKVKSSKIQGRVNWKHLTKEEKAHANLRVYQRRIARTCDALVAEAICGGGLGFKSSTPHHERSLHFQICSQVEVDKQHIDESMGRLSMDFMGPSVQIGTNPSNSEAPLNHNLALPALGDLDLGVVASLPPDLFSEINDIYDGKLINLISKKKGKSVAQERVQVPLKEGSGTFYHHPACVNENRVVDKEEKYPLDKIQPGPSNVGISTEVSNKLDLMPSSLSQVDTSVLQQLPEELRVDILQLLPAHRQPECVSDVNLDPSSKSKELLGLKSPENQPSVSGKELWAGNPPEWVTMFKHSNCCIFRTLADMYYRSGSTGRLSSILQCTLSESQPLVDATNDGWDDAICCLCDLLKQYIKLRVETDIEEIYVSFRLLKRFTIKSKLFSQVYNVVFPQLQASVGENYGGSLHISDGKDQCF
ncbi:hypothetical protein RHSIM_Rhsim05G0088900 [Rhododendron simsii]|uniref:DNA repair protein REV1 n=1 Tax=Rhododendron simsii TaxID=118357 RepID=A0A834H2I4_RHOSS|nr:hypothetical protein RHSIM_Rhsim05G0088900 [Rhododendron simsii]